MAQSRVQQKENGRLRDELDEEIAALERKLATTTIDQNSATEKLSAVAADIKVARATDARMAEQIRTVSTAASASQSEIDGVGAKLRTLIDKIKAQSDEQSVTKSITNSSIRVGIVIIMVFLVQILVSLYRYNTRLAAFYDGRADGHDAFEGGDQRLFENIVTLLSPDTLDFGKPPASPAKHAVELAKTIIDKDSK